MRKSSLEPLMKAIKTCIENHKNSISSFADIEAIFPRELMSVRSGAIGRIFYPAPPTKYPTESSSINGISYYIHKKKDGWRKHAKKFRKHFNATMIFTPQDCQILENGLQNSGL